MLVNSRKTVPGLRILECRMTLQTARTTQSLFRFQSRRRCFKQAFNGRLAKTGHTQPKWCYRMRDRAAFELRTGNTGRFRDRLRSTNIQVPQSGLCTRTRVVSQVASAQELLIPDANIGAPMVLQP